MAATDLESAIRQILSVLQAGVRLDWTDVRVYVIVLVASSVGGIAGSWLHAFFSKRGEIAAVKRDLDQITRIQEEIRSKISTEAWVQQNFWTLKRETYWKLSSVLSELSSTLWDLLRYGFLQDRTVNPNIAVTAPLAQRTTKLLDDLIALTAPSHIVLSGEAVRALQNLKEEVGGVRRNLADQIPAYQVIENVRAAVNRTFDQVVDLAKRDLGSHDPEKA